MICVKTRLWCADNTDIRRGRCLKVYGGSKKRFAYNGEVIRFVVKRRIRRKTIIKEKVYLGLLVSTKRKSRRQNGIFVQYDKNRFLTLDFKQKFLGTRVYGHICREIKDTKKKQTNFRKILSYTCRPT